MLLCSLLPLLLPVGVAAARNLVANLSYGSFQGAYSEEFNIEYWQKIPYAAPPTGENRFRAPQPPRAITGGIYNSSQKFDMCPQRTVNGSEDCLYLGLYARPWQESKALRPVVVTFHGGGFIQGAASFDLPPSAYPILNVSDADIMFVYPNYRLNAFGFLPGKEVAADPHSDLNVGLRDQQAVLKWVQEHIRVFGGDPDNVTIWGQSAGGGSVVAQSIAEHTTPLFKKAWASSPFWPKVYNYASDEAQAVYDHLVELTGCAGPDSLKCLKSVDVQTIRDANLIIADSHKWNTSTFTWGPVIDDDFITQSLSEATVKGNVNFERSFGMYNTHEGENFVPPGLQNATNTGTPPFNSSQASFDKWLTGYLPNLNDGDIRNVEKLYPLSGKTETETYSTAFERAGMIYRDTVLACPAYWLSGAGEQGWLGEYTILPARHASDVYWWNQVNIAQQEDPLHYEGYAGESRQTSIAQRNTKLSRCLCVILRDGRPQQTQNHKRTCHRRAKS